MADGVEIKGQRIKVRNFEQERREELRPMLGEIDEELESCGPEVASIRQSFYDCILTIMKYYEEHVMRSTAQQK